MRPPTGAGRLIEFNTPTHCTAFLSAAQRQGGAYSVVEMMICLAASPRSTPGQRWPACAVDGAVRGLVVAAARP